jgi:hypothetical protein
MSRTTSRRSMRDAARGRSCCAVRSIGALRSSCARGTPTKQAVAKPGLVDALGALRSCIRSLQGASCGVRGSTLSLFCGPRESVRGTFPDDSSCFLDAQCAGGYCAAGALFRCGKCRPLPRVGDPCSFYCDYSVEARVELACDLTTKQCVLPPRAGERCSASALQCARGLVCLASGVCTVPKARLGESCVAGCDEGACGLSGLCEPQDLPAVGEPCIPAVPEGPNCLASAYCRSTGATSADGVCESTKPVGIPCTGHPECGRGRYCVKSDRFRCSDARPMCG